MNLKIMIGRVMRALPPVTPGTYGENNIIDMLNESQHTLLPYTSKTKSTTITLTPGQYEIEKPTDMVSVANILYGADKRELEAAGSRLPKHDLDDESRFGEPLKFYIKDNIIIYPPTKIENTLIINYICKPTDMTLDNDEPEFNGSGEYLIASTLTRIHLEAGSELQQKWEREKMIALHDYMNTYDQNYATPFQITRLW